MILTYLFRKINCPDLGINSLLCGVVLSKSLKHCTPLKFPCSPELPTKLWLKEVKWLITRPLKRGKKLQSGICATEPTMERLLRSLTSPKQIGESGEELLRIFGPLNNRIGQKFSFFAFQMCRISFPLPPPNQTQMHTSEPFGKLNSLGARKVASEIPDKPKSRNFGKILAIAPPRPAIGMRLPFR